MLVLVAVKVIVIVAVDKKFIKSLKICRQCKIDTPENHQKLEPEIFLTTVQILMPKFQKCKIWQTDKNRTSKSIFSGNLKYLNDDLDSFNKKNIDTNNI